MVIERRPKLFLLAVIESGVGSELLQTELRKIYFFWHLRGTLVAKSRVFGNWSTDGREGAFSRIDIAEGKAQLVASPNSISFSHHSRPGWVCGNTTSFASEGSEGRSQRKRTVAVKAPRNCAATKPGASAGRAQGKQQAVEMRLIKSQSRLSVRNSP
jgi:hypothetical protein